MKESVELDKEYFSGLIVIQGRVFSARIMISEIARPLSMIISGPLVDNFFEPGLTNGGYLARMFGWLVGTESGSGIALLFVIVGLLSVLTTIGGYLIKDIREAQTVLPDHNVVVS